MVSLQALHANCNQITDIGPLRELKGLTVVQVFQNQLDDLDACIDVLRVLTTSYLISCESLIDGFRRLCPN